MPRRSVRATGALSGAQLVHLSRFVDRVQKAFDSSRKSVRDDDPDRDLVIDSMVAALLIMAARIASRNFCPDGRARLERSFVLSATEAIEIAAKEREQGPSSLRH